MRLSVDVQKAITFSPWHVTRQLSSCSPIICSESGQRVAGFEWPRARENEAIRLPPLRKGTEISDRSAFGHFSRCRSSAPIWGLYVQLTSVQQERLKDLIKPKPSLAGWRCSDLATTQVLNSKRFCRLQQNPRLLRLRKPDVCSLAGLVAPICFYGAITRCCWPKRS